MKRNGQKEKLVGLLNFEGDVLKAKKAGNDEYVIYDQWDDIVDIVTEKTLFEWLDGEIEFVDSAGKSWNFKKEHFEARIKISKLFQFMKS
jgi:hypothetical protein